MVLCDWQYAVLSERRGIPTVLLFLALFHPPDNLTEMGTFAALAFGMSVGIYTTLPLYLGTYFWEFSSDQLAGLVVPIALATLIAFVFYKRIDMTRESHLRVKTQLSTRHATGHPI